MILLTQVGRKVAEMARAGKSVHYTFIRHAGHEPCWYERVRRSLALPGQAERALHKEMASWKEFAQENKKPGQPLSQTHSPVKTHQRVEEGKQIFRDILPTLDHERTKIVSALDGHIKLPLKTDGTLIYPKSLREFVNAFHHVAVACDADGSATDFDCIWPWQLLKRADFSEFKGFIIASSQDEATEKHTRGHIDVPAFRPQ